MARIVFQTDIHAWGLQDAAWKFMQEGDYEKAAEYLHEALKYAPDDARTHWNLAFSLLAIGDYVQGFKELEWRWQVYDWCWGYLSKDIYRVKDVPAWRGEPLDGKRLLLYHEQGYGDAIMMARYIPVLLRMGAKITLMTCPPLVRLMAHNFPVDVIVADLPQDLDFFDFRCAIFDPMRWLNQTVLTIPRETYIQAILDPIPGTIGIAWSGQAQKERTAEEFVRMFGRDGRKLYAIQPSGPIDGVEMLPRVDFADTLEIIRRMEHIVSVDTAPVHLAAACGHPSVHLLLPKTQEWRWHHAYAWYPRLHLHRDWGSVNEALR